MTEISNHDLREYRQEAERTRDEALSAEATRPDQQRAKVLSVRLTEDEFDGLVRFANALKLPASAVVRGWILDQLRDNADASSESPVRTVERIAHELEQLRRKLAA